MPTSSMGPKTPESITPYNTTGSEKEDYYENTGRI
jgi:hypothetical protein